jgi:hypothetical protein
MTDKADYQNLMQKIVDCLSKFRFITCFFDNYVFFEQKN